MAEASPGESRFAVGSLTRATSYFESANGRGIAIVEFEPHSRRFTVLSTTGGIDNPAYLCFDRERSVLYANSEVEGWNEGTVSAYRLAGDGALFYLNKQATLGSLSAHNCLSPDGRCVVVTNYSHEDGSEVPRRAFSVFSLESDGRLRAASGSAIHEGRGPSDVRQGVPHPHCAVMSRDGRLLSVADLGLDRILHYECDSRTGQVTTPACAATALPPSSGPRHMVEADDGRTVYVVNELASTVVVLREGWRGEPWSIVQTESTLPGGHEGVNLGAAIGLSPDGRHLYCTNRGHDSLVCFRVDPQSGMLTNVGWTRSGGRTPRTFAFTPEGDHILVANQNSDRIVAFVRDVETGGLLEVGSLEIGTPMCIVDVSV